MRQRIQLIASCLLRQSGRQSTLPSKCSRSFSSAPAPPAWKSGIDPHNYNSGRWVRDNKLQHELRFIQFDFDLLCEKVLALSGASFITHCEKTESGLNRVFTFALDNGQRVEARLPFKFAGPERLGTASEVATIQYLQKKTSVPIPQILDWSDDASNLIGSEYIIARLPAGTSLREKWPSMTDKQQAQCITAVFKTLKEVAELKLPAYGSIYFGNTPMIPSSVPQVLDEEFCIGPHSAQMWWDCGAQQHFDHYGKASHGPWPDMLAYSNAVIDTGLARIPPPDRKPSLKEREKPLYHGTVQTHVHLLESTRKVLHALIQDPKLQETSSPLLFPPALNHQNIFVSVEDPTAITGFTNWRSATISPAFVYMKDLAEFSTPPVSARTIQSALQNGEDPSSPSSEEKPRGLYAESYTISVMAATKENTPALYTLYTTPDIIYRPFLEAPKSWTSGAPYLRHELLSLKESWSTLEIQPGFPLPALTDAELEAHGKELKFVMFAAQIGSSMLDLIDVPQSGWTDVTDPVLWREKEGILAAHFIHGMETFAEPQLMDPEAGIYVSQEDFRALWPFDLP